MIDECRSRYHIFNSDYLFEVNGELEFREKNRSGAGAASFRLASRSIALRAHDNPPLVWSLKVRNCADGAFITFRDQSAHLHIVELKSGLSQRDWARALE